MAEEERMYRNLTNAMAFYLGFALVLIIFL